MISGIGMKSGDIVTASNGKAIENLKSKLTLWKLRTLPPVLISFKGHVHPIDLSWHVHGLGYQNNTNIENVKKATVIHYSGQLKPWLEIGFEHLRPFWTKYVNYSSDFVKNSCSNKPASIDRGNHGTKDGNIMDYPEPLQVVIFISIFIKKLRMHE